MSAEFLSGLRGLSYREGESYPWLVGEPLVYYSELDAIHEAFEGGIIQVPTGYVTDFASVPRIPVIYAWVGGRAVLPAVVHDYLYDCHDTPLDAGISRRVADLVFLEAMKAANDPKWGISRRVMYAGVRAGGWRGWNRDNSHKIAPFLKDAG